MYVHSGVYIKNYSWIFLEWIIAKRGWVQIRSLSSAIYFVFMFLSLVTQTCSISSLVLVPLCSGFGAPSPGTSVWSEPSWALLCYPGLLSRLWTSLQMGPCFLIRAKGLRNGGWVLGAAPGSSGESRVLSFPLDWVVQRSFSGTCVCVEGLSSLRADVVGILMDSWELLWTGWVFLCCKFTELRAAFSEGRKWKQKALASHLL